MSDEHFDEYFDRDADPEMDEDTTTAVAVVPERQVPAPRPDADVPAPALTISRAPVEKGSDAHAVLMKYQQVPDEWLDIKPNGQIYLSHMKLRSVFNEAFGFMGWGILPLGDYKVDQNGDHITVYREFQFYVHGHFVGQTVAAGDYYTTNADANYGDACEAAQSYALNRFGKPFGIASQCWDKTYAEQWRNKYAEQYTDKRGREQWRKKGDRSADSTGKWVDTGAAVPNDYWKTRDIEKLGGAGHKAMKTESGWHIFELVKES